MGKDKGGLDDQSLLVEGTASESLCRGSLMVVHRKQPFPFSLNPRSHKTGCEEPAFTSVPWPSQEVALSGGEFLKQVSAKYTEMRQVSRNMRCGHVSYLLVPTD